MRWSMRWRTRATRSRYTSDARRRLGHGDRLAALWANGRGRGLDAMRRTRSRRRPIVEGVIACGKRELAATPWALQKRSVPVFRSGPVGWILHVRRLG